MNSTDHFDSTDGVLSPQPWMQLRRVAETSTGSVFRTYAATGGQNKDEVLHTVTATWTNNTPISQHVYGMVHQGGCAVALQARSRGYLRTSHSIQVALNPRAIPASPLVEVSRFGGGVDVGAGGQLGFGTEFAIHEVRCHSSSVPLMPGLTGWTQVAPGESFTAAVEVRFVSEVWEGTVVSGGNDSTNCTVVAGELAVDVWAVPIIGDPPARTTPLIVGATAKMKTSKDIQIAAPAGATTGDVLLAIVGNNFGDPRAITAPPEWTLIHAVDTNSVDWFNAHVKVFAKPADYVEGDHTFTNAFGAEQIVHMLALRGAVMPSAGADANGWSVASTRTKYATRGDMHVAPSVSSGGQLLICVSFFGLADNIFDGFGVVQVQQTRPAGMTETVNLNGSNSSMCAAVLADPPNPTQERKFTTTPRAYFTGTAVTLAILVAGQQQF